MHEGLLRSLSPVLLAACDGKWKEQISGRYKFSEDVTERTLLCFLTWAYNGDYDSNDEAETRPSPNEALVRYEKGTNGERAPEEPLGETPAAAAAIVDKEQRVMHPLLLHISLYVFADVYQIEPLKASTKQKILDQLEKLENLPESHERVAIFDLLDYAFSRLPEQDPLLHWLARYASWKLDDLRHICTRLDNLLSENDGKFARMLVRYLYKSTVNPFSLTPAEITPRYPIMDSRSSRY